MTTKRIKQFWRHRRVTIIYILLIIVSVLFLAFIRNRLGLVLQLNADFSSQSETWWQMWAARATILNLFVDIVGFGLAIAGGWFAVREIQAVRRAAERRPDLRVVEKEEGASITFQRDKRFTLMVTNYGRGVAQHFLVQLEVPTRILKRSYWDPSADDSSPSLSDALSVSGGARYWKDDCRPREGIMSLCYYNQGDFPCFDSDQIPLAEFEFSSDPAPSSLRGQVLRIGYSIQSEGMKRRANEIRIIIPANAWEW